MDDIADIGLSSSSRILAVSPHPDDIALSCGGLMRLLQDIDITLFTCFTRSYYAPFVELKAALSDVVREIRTREDREYARQVGAKYIELGLEDVSVRFPDMAEWICKHPKKENSYVSLVEKIVEAVSPEYTHILCPLGIGYNIDHLITHDAIRGAASVSQRVLFYEDLPYGMRVGGPRTVIDYVNFIVPQARPIRIDITNVISAKISGLEIYRSQIYPEDVASVVQYAAEIGTSGTLGERLWTAPFSSQGAKL